MIGIKKKLVAPIVALMFVCGTMVSGAWAETSTQSGYFVIDKTTVTAGETINLSILGLDEEGKVDLFGEQFGATIMAVVSSQLGEVKDGGTSGNWPVTGSWAATIKYIELVQGVGQVHIKYPATVSGTDKLTVTLQEKFFNEQGGVTYNTIDTFSQNVTVNAASAVVKSLDITKFEPSPADDDGDDTPADGINGAMTAGIAGGQVTIKADNDAASGPVTLTLYTALGTAYTFTGTMGAGTATITFDSSVTKAGKYYIKAELEGFDGDSIDFNDSDTLTVKAKQTVKGLLLASEKSVISNDNIPNASTVVTAYVLDEYGNKTTNNTGTDITLEIKDDNEVVSDTALTITIIDGASEGTDYLGEGNNDVLKLGTASLVASTPAIATIADSAPLEIKVVDKNLIAQLDATFTSSKKAGENFDAFNVRVDADVFGDYAVTDSVLSDAVATTMVIKHVVNGFVIESIEANIAADYADLEALFQKATGTITAAADEYYIIADKKNRYGECIVANQGGDTNSDILTAAPNSAKVVNGHNEEVTTIPVNLDLVTGNYVAKIPEAQLKMADSFGNSITSVDAGTFSITSEKGEVGLFVAGDGDLTPGGTDGTIASITYDPNVFTGTDTIELAYTKPGVETNTLEATVPAKPELNSIVISVSQANIPLNGVIAVSVETLDQNGAKYDDPTGIIIGISGTVTPTVEAKNPSWTTLSSGQRVDFTTGPGRNVLAITVQDITGEFTLSFSNADGTVTAEKKFTVTEIAQPGPTVIGEAAGASTTEVAATDSLELNLNVTPEAGDTPAQEYLAINFTQGGVDFGWFVFTPAAGFVPVGQTGWEDVQLDTSGAVNGVLSLAVLSMDDLTLGAGDTFTYGYAYTTTASDFDTLVFSNVNTIVVK